ncbi:MAG TPA: hypothetical protein VN259_14020 [Xanthomonadales bacterium]|nr:hypothetical protein [Xanthomonadales bacterium]
MSIVFRCAAAIFLALACAPAIGERLKFDGGERASTPALAVDPARGLVLTWQTRDDAGAALRYALLDANGREIRRGVVAQGADWFVNWADFPSLVVLDNNDWVSYWLQKSAPDTYAYDLRVTRSTNGGGRWSEPLTPHDDGTRTEHGFASLLALDGARVQIVWLDGRHSQGATSDHAAGHGDEEGPMTLRSAVLDWHGRIEEAHELDALTCSCCQTDAARVGKRTLVVYRDRSDDQVRDIALVERKGKGAWSQPQIVHADGWKVSACPVNGPAIAANGDTALIAWPTLADAPMSLRYVLRKGQTNSPMRVLEQGTDVIGRVDASAATNGGFAVSWLGAGKSGNALKLATLDASGKLLRVRDVATLEPGRSTGNPRLVWYRDAHYLTWTESAGDGKTRIAIERIAP